MRIAIHALVTILGVGILAPPAAGAAERLRVVATTTDLKALT